MHKTILLVDDQHQILLLYSRLLLSEGFIVLRASDADAALTTCKAHSGEIDLLVADIFLECRRSRVSSSLNGLELARRAIDLRPRLEVLFISGHSDAAIDALGGLPQGAAFLHKPFKTQEFLALIHRLLHLPG